MPLGTEGEMPKPYSLDPREGLLEAYLADEETIEEIAVRYDAGRTTVVKWVALYRGTGNVAPRETKRGPPSTVTAEQTAVLRKIIARHPDLTYDELTERWNRALGTDRRRSTTVRVVLGLGYTLRKGHHPGRAELRASPDTPRSTRSVPARDAGTTPDLSG